VVSDPIALEIVKNALSTAAQEMGLSVVRSAYSTIVKEIGDATAAVFDGAGRLVAQSVGAPLMHLSSLRPSLQELLRDYPAERMREGDVFASNDPYRGGIHSNDVMLFRPVFFDGRPAFFTAALLHVADLGGVAAGGLPANATDIFHEGLVLPPVPLQLAGEPHRPVLDIIAANSRTPEKTLGDVRAMLGGVNVGARRLEALVARYGIERLLALTAELMDYSERRTRQEIGRLPPGVQHGSFVIDDDGVEPDKTHWVQVELEIRRDSIRADFRGTAPQSRGPINAARSQSMSGVLYAVRCFLDPWIPVNEGCYRPLEVELPEGTLVNPRPPAACNARMATVMAIVESLLQAFAAIAPHKAVAASANTHLYTLSGVDPATRRLWAYLDPQFGGVGARADRDGLDGTAPLIFAGAGTSPSVEAYEIEYPVRFRRFERWRDSGGPGRWRGGLGTRREIEVLTDAEVTARATDRCRIPPPGAFGGRPGRGGGWIVDEGTPGERVLPPKVTGHALRAGQRLTMLTSAGGGCGPAEQRDPQLVLDDVREGRVSLEGARRDYAVAIDPLRLCVLDEETARLRAEARR
jgi:N-methylhydantoinase B